MWFQLNTTFSTHLGALSTLQSNYGVTYSLSNFTKTTAPDMVEKDKSLTVILTMTEGATFSTASMTDGTNTVTGSLSGSTVTMTISSVKGPVTVTARATVAGGDSEGDDDANEGGDTITPDTPTTGTDITDLFTFSLTGTAYQASGATKSSTYFDSCSPVDISSYSGTHLQISHAKFTPTSGSVSGYGAVFFDASGNLLKQEAFPLYTSSGPKGTYINSYLEIPSGAATFATSIFNSAAVSNSVYEGTTSDFYCSVVDLSQETDITSMFDFDTSGYAWKVSDGDGEVTSYATKYWNSDTVDMSAYAGRAIKIAAPIARTTSNTQVPYGYAYEDASGNNYVLHHFALLNDGGTLLAGDVTDLTIALPNNIKNFLVCYFSDEMYNAANPITDTVRNGFYCKVLG